MFFLFTSGDDTQEGICVHIIELNKITIKYKFSIPIIDDLLN